MGFVGYTEAIHKTTVSYSCGEIPQGDGKSDSTVDGLSVACVSLYVRSHSLQ